MNDRHLDPPEHPEPPDWYSAIELVLIEEDRIPQKIADSIQKLLSVWYDEHNASQDIEPPDDPKLDEGDYLKDQYDDREEDVDDYDYEADDRAFDAARESR